MTAALLAADNPVIWQPMPPLPDELGVAGHFAGVSGGALVVAGGANFPEKMPWEGGRKVWHDRIWVLDEPEGAWREAGRLPRPLGYGISATWRDGVVCVGGSDAERHYSEAFLLSREGSAFESEPLAALPIALSGASGALVGDVLYVAGGSEEPGEQRATSRAFSLDLAGESPSWRELPPVPGKGRILATAAAHGGAFYVMGGAALEANSGGRVARVLLREAWSYRPDRGWQRLADLPEPSVAAPSPAPVVEGRILLAGGDNGSRAGFQPIGDHPGFARVLLAYDPEHNLWSEAAESPAPRATAPVVEWRGRFVIPSGEVRPGVRSPEVWSLRAH